MMTEMNESNEKEGGIAARARRLGRNAWLVGIGAVAIAGDGARGLVERLKTRGKEIEQDESSTLRQAYDSATSKVKRTGTNVEDAVRGKVSSALQRTGVPSREEIRELIDRVEKLTAKVDSLGAAR